MTNDLHAALAALGREERDAAPPLPIDTLTVRAHRTRARHAATYSAIGAGAAAVLAVGALTADGLWQDREDTPVPPATEVPRETPTATPTPTATATPSAGWEPSWELCGMPGEDLYARDTSWDWENETGWWLESAWPYDTVVPVDGPLPLTLSVNGHDVAGASVEVQLTALVALEIDNESGAGWVAGVAASPTDDLFQGTGTDERGIPLGSIETRFVSCEASPLLGGDGALETVLTGEGYDVLAVAEIRSDGDGMVTTVNQIGHVGEYPEMPNDQGSDAPSTNIYLNPERGTLTIGTPLRRGPATTGYNTDFWINVAQRWCGTPSSTEPLHNDQAPAMSLTGTGFRDGDELIVQMTFTNAGDSPLQYALLAYPHVSVSRNGLVVREFSSGMASFALPLPFQPGDSVQLETPLGESTCAAMGGEPWPAGTYELQVEALLVGAGLVPAEQGSPTLPRYQARTTFTLD